MRRTAAGFAALVVAAPALAGCSLLFPPPRPRQAAHVPPPPHPAAGTAPSGSAAAAAALHPSPPAPPAPPAAAPVPAQAPSPPVNVVGLSQAEVRRQLGPPSASTTQGSAQTWTYHAAGCSVAIAFYYDVTRSGFFALSARREGDGDGDAAGCLAQVHDAQRS